mgnify:CR=1 FL=1
MPKRRNQDKSLTPIVVIEHVWFDIPKKGGENTEVLVHPEVADYIEMLEDIVNQHK